MLENSMTILNMFFWHISKKLNIKRSTIVIMIILTIVSILLPVVISYIIFKSSDSEIIDLILTYLIGIIWALAIITLFQPIILNRIKTNFKYAIKLAKLINLSHRHFLNEYRVYVDKYLVRKDRHEEFKKYDIVIVDTIFSQIFIMYFNNINEKVLNNNFFMIESNNIKKLNETKKFESFYSKIFFNLPDSMLTTPFDTVKIKIMDKVISKLQSNEWFDKYYDDIAVYKLITFLLDSWWANILAYGSKLTKNDFKYNS